MKKNKHLGWEDSHPDECLDSTEHFVKLNIKRLLHEILKETKLSVPLFFSLEKNLLAVGVEAAVVAVGFSVTTVLVSLTTAGSVGSAVGPTGATGTGCTSVDMVGAPQGKEKRKKKKKHKAPQNKGTHAVKPHIYSTGPRRKLIIVVYVVMWTEDGVE